ncbi:MAG: GNAT family N-acetyltransferase [Euryarchaeota archaeon]|nr:GNAT family N-acetyltransferase [Euryarchaeota archaeon]MDE1835741.1 GNAT family N-acetyltransferase [Euryarchaeota archaeon]MDE1880834.1 GNAT family N-acetyltransferase [Euryarchaeota archaeon]MDE2043932.1 GNAT family N-acetyltransferase [Thermoplasmata archaeon]
MAFVFDGPPRLSDGVIDLVLVATDPADPSKDYVPEYRYRIEIHGGGPVVGEVRLRVGRTRGLLTGGHIGYGVEAAHRGHHFAERACRLVGQVALHHGLDPLIITCAPENISSRRTCERLGAKLLGEFDVPPDHDMYQRGRRKVLRYEWRLTSLR